jgi:hypothetical protein
MSFTKALYYPTIDIHNEDWLKNAILFWDEINTIVPVSIDDPYQTDTTQYLSSEGILKPLHVNPDNVFIDELTTDVLKYFRTTEGHILLTNSKDRRTTLRKNKLHLNEKSLFEIHPDKLPYEIQKLLKHSIAENGWFRVNSNFSFFYMTLLANKICEKKSIALLTDNNLTSDLNDIVRLDNRLNLEGNDYDFYKSMKNEKHINMAQGLLTNLVIKSINISKSTSLEDIIIFKKKNKNELGKFRINVAELTKDIQNADFTFEQMKQQIEDIYNDKFLPAYNDLKKALESAGVKWTTDNFLKVSFFSTSTTAIPMTLLGLSLPQALLSGAGVSIVSSLVSYNIGKKKMLRKNPYTYLLLANKGI